MEKQVLIFAVHGFLCVPNDFNFLTENLNPKIYKCELVNLFQNKTTNLSYVTHYRNTVSRNENLSNSKINNFITENLSENFTSINSFDEWTKKIKNKLLTYRAQNFKIILCGYSLGGRLLLDIVFNHTDLWDHAHIISSNIGLQNNDEKLQRLQSDSIWKTKFISCNSPSDWEHLLKDWNNQDVLKDDFEPVRHENSYQKNLLGLAFDNWSLGKQNDYWNLIGSFQKTVHLWSGTNDLKFNLLNKKISEINPKFNHHSIPNLKHRLIFNKDFQNLLIEQIYKEF